MRKRVVLFSGESVFGSAIINKLLNNQSIDLTGVFYSTRVYRKSSSILSFYKVLSITGMQYYCNIVKLNAPFARLFYPEISRTHEICRQKGIPVIYAHDVNSPGNVERIRQLRPDIILSAHFNQLIKEPVISLPADVLNIHPGILPEYRGLDPLLQQIIHGEDHMGVTLHRVDDTFDTGEILRQDIMPLNSTQSLFELYIILWERGVDLLEDYIHSGRENIENLTERQQRSLYFSWPAKKDVRLFLKNNRFL
jgi:methionyl-tRNA formyltransferase